MLTIAHRGASGCRPENTLASFARAAELGADMCELDVHLARDGVAVVIHDDTVDRTTNGRGRVAAMSFDELRRLDAGCRFGDGRFAGEMIPSLEEVFAATRGRCGLNVELKAPGAERIVAPMMRRFDALNDSIVSSFDWDSLARLRAIDSAIQVGFLADKNPRRMFDAAAAARAYALCPEFKLATAEFCAEAHRRGLAIYAWTVDDEAAMKTLTAAGVDGIMTNFPGRMRRLMAV